MSNGNSESRDMPAYLQNKYTCYANFTPQSTYKPKKVYPEYSYGISFESPSYFKTQHTLYHTKSYKNPFLGVVLGPKETKEEQNVSDMGSKTEFLKPNMSNRKSMVNLGMLNTPRKTAILSIG
jgi:hypothetical protein